MTKIAFQDSELQNLISNNKIISEQEIDDKQIQPASLDLRVGKEGFCVPYSSLPNGNSKLRDYFRNIANYKLNLRKDCFLHKGFIYVFKLNERLNLPDYLEAKCNPKSSIGRIDGHVRAITENTGGFDIIPAGYKGELWLEVYPTSFDFLIREGDTLNQLRIFNSKEIKGSKLEESLQNYSKRDILRHKDIYLDLSEEEFVGYVAKPNSPPVDLSKRNSPLSEYFDKVGAKNKEIILQKGLFYLLNSKEIIEIPLEYCAEMSDIHTSLGEYRAHYAGFFDPGFKGQAVLEIRNLGAPFMIKDGQRIAGLNYYPLKSKPQIPYGNKGSHYQNQKGPKLAKFFSDTLKE